MKRKAYMFFLNICISFVAVSNPPKSSDCPSMLLNNYVWAAGKVVKSR